MPKIDISQDLYDSNGQAIGPMRDFLIRALDHAPDPSTPREQKERFGKYCRHFRDHDQIELPDSRWREIQNHCGEMFTMTAVVLGISEIIDKALAVEFGDPDVGVDGGPSPTPPRPLPLPRVEGGALVGDLVDNLDGFSG